jgi:hypothetical protein
MQQIDEAFVINAAVTVNSYRRLTCLQNCPHIIFLMIWQRIYEGRKKMISSKKNQGYTILKQIKPHETSIVVQKYHFIP